MDDAEDPLSPAGLYAGVPYAYSAVVPAGARAVFLAGACPLDQDGQVVAAGDVAGQSTACIRNMVVALEAAGARLPDVVFVRVLVATASRADLVTAWEVVRHAFRSRHVPGTLQGVTVLGWEGQLVEVEAVAALPG